MIRAIVKDAPTVWNYLNGVVNVFKPAGVSVKQVKKAILGNLSKGNVSWLPMEVRSQLHFVFCTSDINSLETRPPRERVVITNAKNNDYDVNVEPDWSDHVLAAGPRYEISDFKLSSSHLGRLTSGVLRMFRWAFS